MAQRNGKTEEEVKTDSTPENTNSGNTSTGSPLGTKSRYANYAKRSSEYLEMLNHACNLGTSFRTGASLRLTVPGISDGSSHITVNSRDVVAPGIIVYDWIPTMGVIDSDTSVTNLASKEIYAYIKKNNPGARNYEPSDATIMTFALDSIYSLYYAGMRVYGLLDNYTPMNSYYPKTIVQALGFDYDDWVSNRTKFIGEMMSLRGTIKQFILPPTCQMYKDHIDMNTLIYTDGSIDRSQMYAFKQTHFYSYEKVDEVKGLTLRMLPATSTVAEGQSGLGLLTTVDDYLKFMRELITAFINSTDVAVINADIIHAYSADEITNTLPQITTDYVTPVVKDDMMLLSIMNAVTYAVCPESCRIYDYANGNLRAFPEAHPTNYESDEGGNWIRYPKAYGNYGYGNVNFINCVSDAPSVEELQACLRFRPWIDTDTLRVNVLPSCPPDWTIVSYENAGTSYRFKYVGTEILTRATAIGFNNDSATNMLVWDPDNGYGDEYAKGYRTADVSSWHELSIVRVTGETTFEISNFGIDRELDSICMLSAFDWHHPMFLIGNGNIADLELDDPTVVLGGKINFVSQPIADVQNLVPIMEETVEQVTNASLYLSFFG